MRFHCVVRLFVGVGVAATLSGASTTAFAQAANTVVWRCPGPPILYTDTLSAAEAKEKGCKVIEGAPVTVIQGPRPRAPVAAASNGARPADARIDPAEQRARDSDARRILESELKREEERLAELKREYNNGEPERRGDERNYQKYLDRVADLRNNIGRREADIEAIKRELAKLPPPKQ
jgi:hypothetical protein